MIYTLNSIESIIWNANKHGRNSISINPNDKIQDGVLEKLKVNGFILRHLPTISGKFLYWEINW